MDFELSENQKMLKQSLREMLIKEFPKQYFREKDAKAEWPGELVTKLGELGYLGIPVPVEYGGSGGNTLDCALVQEELSKVCGGSGAFYVLFTSIGATVLGHFGTEKQKSDILPKLAKGQVNFSFACTEPSGGTDILAMTSRGERDGKGNWILNGQKTFISGAHVADWFVTVVKTGNFPGKKLMGYTAFLLDTKTPGIDIKRISIESNRSTGANDVFYTDVIVPEEYVIGEVNRAFYQLFVGMNNERIIMSAHYLGVASAALDIAVQWAKDRQAFGGPIGRFQAIQHRLADAYIKMEVARSYLYKTASMEANGIPCQLEATATMRLCTDTAMQTVESCMRVMGGYAICAEYDMDRYFRDTVIGVNGPLSNEMCLNQIAETLGLPRSY